MLINQCNIIITATKDENVCLADIQDISIRNVSYALF